MRFSNLINYLLPYYLCPALAFDSRIFHSIILYFLKHDHTISANYNTALYFISSQDKSINSYNRLPFSFIQHIHPIMTLSNFNHLHSMLLQRDHVFIEHLVRRSISESRHQVNYKNHMNTTLYTVQRILNKTCLESANSTKVLQCSRLVSQHTSYTMSPSDK